MQNKINFKAHRINKIIISNKIIKTKILKIILKNNNSNFFYFK